MTQSPTDPTAAPKTAMPKTAASTEADRTAAEANRQGAATRGAVSGEANAVGATAKAEASKTYETAADEAARLKNKAANLGEQAKSAATEAATRAKTEARDYARSIAEDGKSQAAAGVKDVARALEDAAGNLDERYGFVSNYMREAAGEVDRVASNLRGRSVDDLVYSAENFARRNPTAFLGLSVLAGFAAARFIKSSAPDEDDYGHDAGYRGRPHYGLPAERDLPRGGAGGDPYAEAGIPSRAVNPPNRAPASGPSTSGVTAASTPAGAAKSA